MIKNVSIFVMFLISFSLFSQDVELNRINALDEFRWGVRFYNQGLYEKSVFSFERSLSFDSLDLRTNLWLGQAYFMKGDVEAALEEWALLEDKKQSPIWLDKSIEMISVKRGVLNRLYNSQEWVQLYNENISRPSSILAKEGGGSIIVSFLKNNLTVLNSNGAITETFNGGFEPFNRPFDIIKNDNGGYIVSEFMGDKISFINDLGVKIRSVNPKESPLSGPGYLTKSGNGYFYVSDWGNRRVCKFDMDGNLILSITNELLDRPTGILVIEDELYVVDATSKSILLFDNSGNLLRIVLNEGLESPEGLSLKEMDVLYIADGTTLKEFNLKDKILTKVTDLEGKASRITKAVIDVNGNTLVTDFNLGKFYSLTDISTLYGGLYIVIDRVSSINFPNMEIELQVYNRQGQPVIGLDNTNFLISEQNKIVKNRDVIFKGNENRSINMGLVLDLDKTMSSYYENFYGISKTIEDELIVGDSISLITAGQLPEIAVSSKSKILNAVSNIKSDQFTDREGIDLSIKLAASSLMPSRAKREIVLLTSGIQKENDFVKYSLNEIRDFLINNRISLTVLYLEDTINPELEYLVEESNGSSRYLFSSLGSKGIVTGLRNKKSGFYVLNYESLKNIDNGEVFTTVEVEINFIRKSGRSESGFFVPVKVVK